MDGHLYVASEHTGEILQYDLSTGIFLGVFSSLPKETFHPMSILFVDNFMLVSSYSPGRIRKFDAITG